MHVIRCLALLGSIAVSLHAVPAAAQPAQPAPVVDKAKAKVARQYVDAGLAAQNSGDYDTAITFYSKAFQLVPHPVLIFNIAQAHRLAGRIDQAMRMYATYLKEDPNGAQAQTARDLIAEITARKAEEARKADEVRQAEEARKADEARKVDEARRAEEARKLDQARKADEARKADAHQAEAAGKADQQRKLEPARVAEQQRIAGSQPAAGAAPAASGPDQPESPAQQPGRNLRIAGIAAGSTGVVGIAIGIGFGFHGRSLSNELSQSGAPYDASKVDAGNRANTLEGVGLIGGTALVAAGAVLYWRGYLQDQRGRGVALAPLLSDHVAGLCVGGFLP